MTLRIWVTWIGLLALVGCGKDIGDSCKSVNECISTDTDRLCLTQDGEGFPGGYCTKFNCGGSNTCPEEATCVAYRSTLGGGECSSDTTISRLQRNYCMLRCEQDSDCRAGYRCLAADGNNPLGALIIDGHVGAKICTLSYDEPQRAPDRESEVCAPTGLRGLDADAGSAASETPTSDAASEMPTSEMPTSEMPTSDAASETPTSETPASDAASGTPTSAPPSDASAAPTSSTGTSELTSSTESSDAATSQTGQTTEAPLSTLETLAPDAALLSSDASPADASGP